MPRSRLADVAAYFTVLGFTAFGGPAAHVSLMEEGLVRRRKWLDREAFLDAVAAINFIPGPNSTELAIHLGYRRAGYAGLVVAGVCFIAPAVLVILPIAWLYVRYGDLPAVAGVRWGVSAAVVGVVAAAAARFARTGVTDAFAAVVAALATAAGFAVHAARLPAGDVAVLAAAAVAGLARRSLRRGGVTPALAPAPLASLAKPAAALLAAAAAAAPAAGFAVMALALLKIGATLFGSGYVLVTYLQSTFVDRLGWLTPRELLDAVAVGQVTPGPLLTTATFVGFVLGSRRFGAGLAGGAFGAALATASIFLPSFVFVAALSPALPKLRRAPDARAALDAMNAAVVGLIASTVLSLAAEVARGPAPLAAGAVAAACLALLVLTRVNATWLLLAAAAGGWAWGVHVLPR